MRDDDGLDENPLLAVYAAGGEAAVERWIEDQTEWSSDEVSQMLCELAMEIASAGLEPTEDEDDDAGDDDDNDDDDDDDDDDGGDDEDDDDDDDEADGNEDEDRGRQITTYARELLTLRGEQGLLDPRGAERLGLPVSPPRSADAADDEGFN